MLSKREHYVTRWAPTFAHAYKKQRYMHDHTIQLNDHYRIRFLYAKGYQKNISFSRIRFNYQIARAFTRCIKDEIPPDIILSAIPTPEMSKVAIKYANYHHIPAIIDVRDFWPDIFLDAVPRGMHWLAKSAFIPAFQKNRSIFHEATGIIGICDYALKWGLNYAGRNPTEIDRVFYHGYRKITLSDSEIQEAEVRWLKRGLLKNSFLCCFFGTISHQFDLATVISGAKHFEGCGKDIQFILCGDGDRLNYYKKIAAGSKNVILPGWIDLKDITALMSWSKVGLLPYATNINDACRFSVTQKTFEYFSAGLPVISSLRGEMESILSQNDCGFTYEAGDAQSFINAVKRLHNDPMKLEHMGENAHKLFEERFSAEVVYPAMIDHLEQIVKGELKERS